MKTYRIQQVTREVRVMEVCAENERAANEEAVMPHNQDRWKVRERTKEQNATELEYFVVRKDVRQTLQNVLWAVDADEVTQAASRIPDDDWSVISEDASAPTVLSMEAAMVVGWGDHEDEEAK